MRLNRNKYRQFPESETSLRNELRKIEESIEYYRHKKGQNVKLTLECLITKKHEFEGKIATINMERDYIRKEEERRKRRERKLLRESQNLSDDEDIDLDDEDDDEDDYNNDEEEGDKS